MLTHKVKSSYLFLDLSDYARPLADHLTKILIPSEISSFSITLFFAVFGLCSAAFYATGDLVNIYLAAIFLQIKNILDAVDGALARSRNQPTKTGRFLDSILDFGVNFFVYWGIFFAYYGKAFTSLWISLICLLFAHLQCSYYNYAYLIYRSLTKGNTTSTLKEENFFCYPYENKKIALFLQKIYLIIYGWQDKIMIYLENFLLNKKFQNHPQKENILFKLNTDKKLLTQISFLGLGTQILIIDFFSLAGIPHYALIFFATFGNIYFILIFLLKRINLKKIIKNYG